MANDIATKDTFSYSLTTELESNKSALPADFNITRFVQNSLALLNGNETLREFAGKYGSTQIKQGLMRGAYLGLDALNSEMYLVPYGKTLNFMPSYRGMTKLVAKYSVRPVKSIYAKVVRQGDTFEETIVNGEPTINYKALPFNDDEIIGVFAVCQYVDGGCQYEVMSKAEIEQCRKASKSNNRGPWVQWYAEMAKKCVIRRLCKSLSLDMDAKGVEAMNAGLEIETDVREQVKNEIEAEANQIEFDPDEFEDVVE